ncbi:hypothetical protein BDZ91DRAFT_798208 [Kalaharituber pfeilii]|nr:hypothetical protein BDZ91DRAFT_798208 [Kalaharituber pfeilii]
MDAFVIEAFTLLAVAVTCIGLRTYARWAIVGFSSFAVDDYLMLVAGVVYALETGAAYSVGAVFYGLANNGMSDEQRATLEPGSQEWNLRVGGSKLQMVGWSLYTLLLWLLKACMAIFYSRITDGLRDMKIRVRIAFISIGATYIATILSIMFGCVPFKKNWQITPDPGNHCQPAISHINLYVTVVLNVVTDLYLMSIPLPLLWRANITMKRKALLLVMFSGGAFIIMAGILRCALIIADPINGAQQAGSWACRETFVSVIIGNIPMIYPMFLRTVKKVSNSVFSSGLGSSLGKRSANNTNGDLELGDRDRYERPSKPLRRKPNPMSIPGLTTIGKGDSEEQIITTSQETIDVNIIAKAGHSRDSMVGISVVTDIRSESTRENRSTTSLDQGSLPPRSPDGNDQNKPFYGEQSYTVQVNGGNGGANSHAK